MNTSGRQSRSASPSTSSRKSPSTVSPARSCRGRSVSPSSSARMPRSTRFETMDGADVSEREESFGTRGAVVAADFMLSRLEQQPGKIAIVLGSGLGGLARRIESAERIEFREIPGFPESTVVGHAGALICGRLAGKAVLALSGSFHVYEGHGARLAGFP